MTETKRCDIMPHNIIDNANAILQHINYKQKIIQAYFPSLRDCQLLSAMGTEE